ncbi:membrane protein, partial [Candidatus Magnetoovum chiemensis]
MHYDVTALYDSASISEDLMNEISRQLLIIFTVGYMMSIFSNAMTISMINDLIKSGSYSLSSSFNKTVLKLNTLFIAGALLGLLFVLGLALMLI